MDPTLTYQPGPAAYALGASPARFAIERGEWKEASKLPVRHPDYTWDRFPWAEAMAHAARGLGAARSGDAKSAKKSLEVLAGLKQREKNKWWQQRIQIQMDVIGAWVAHLRVDDDKALAMLAAATKTELDNGKWSVEPGHVISAAENHAVLLLELYRGKELAQLPERAKDYYTQLIAIAADASIRPALAHAKEFLSK